MNYGMTIIKRGKRKKRSELKTLLMLVTLKLEGPIGRYRLKNILELSEQEGLVRLMLFELKQKNLIKTSRAGCELTKKGGEFLKESLQKYGIVDIKEMNLDSFQIASESIIIQSRGHSVSRSVVTLRDVAVRAGASGAILITYEQGILKIPTVYSSLRNNHPNIVENLHKTLKLSDGDVIIVCFSRDKWRALEGGLSIAMCLSKES